MDHTSGVDSLGEDASFDHYARLIRRLLHVPISLVTIVEAHRQVFPGASGLQEPYRSSRQTPISHSYCQYVVADGQPLVVSDARQEPRFTNSPAIADLEAIAYAGWPLVDGDGHTIGSLCAIDTEPREWNDDEMQVLQDLALACSAELQQTRRVATEGESLARAIFDSVEVAMAFYDPRGRLVLANDLAERAATAAGHRLDQPPYAGPHVRRADNTTPVAAADQVIPRALRGELHHQMGWVGPRGNDVAIVASSRPVLRTDGSYWGTLIAGHDVTDLACALVDLQRATQVAQSATETKSIFLANMSHELRTPLTTLLAAGEMLEETDPTPVQSRLLDAMTRSGNRLQELIESILDFTNIEAGDLDLHVAAFDLRATIADVVAASSAAAACGLEVRAQVDPRLPELVVADSDRLKQALKALVENAIKFTAGGSITIAVSRDDLDTAEPGIVFDVADTGIGIPPERHSDVFEAFTQIDPTMTRRHEGSGLGLAICKQLVTLMGGDIRVRSTPGQGATFTIRLPLLLP